MHKNYPKIFVCSNEITCYGCKYSIDVVLLSYKQTTIRGGIVRQVKTKIYMLRDICVSGRNAINSFGFFCFYN